MRGLLPDLEPALPMVLQLPAVYQEDEFTTRFLSAFDVVLAPVVATLDDLHAYVDPALAPDDFLAWLAGWVGVTLEAAGSPAARRAVVGQAVSLHRQRGTVRGIAELARLAVGEDVQVDVEESGAATWSRVPRGALPGTPDARVRVVVRSADPDAVDVGRLTRLVTAAAPAHVVLEIEVQPLS
ncbi:MAG: phage tail protein [Frankiales bacterium]|nr:phage tail protein [Frankiales bacterium]